MKKTTETEPKLYPRRCAECGAIAVQPATISYEASMKHDGKIHAFTIELLPVDRCTECEEIYMTAESSRKKTRALCDHLDLIDAEDIRRKLTQLGINQRTLAAHLRVAEESISRWVNELSVPSRSMSVLMQLYFELPVVRQLLSSGSSIPVACQQATVRSIPIDMSMPTVQLGFAHRQFPEATLRRQQAFELNPTI